MNKKPSTQQIQLGLLALISAFIVNFVFAEAEINEAESAPRLSDIPYIECFIKSAERYEVDLELAVAVAIVESSLNPDAISSSDAIGIMQIKWPITADHLGITQRELLFDPCINIDAGVSYLKELLVENAQTDTADVPLRALASYRLGPTTIAAAEVLPDEANQYAQAVIKQRDALLIEPFQNQASPDQQASASAAREPPAALETAEKITEESPDDVENTQALAMQTSDLFLAVKSDAESVVEISPEPVTKPCTTAGVRTLIIDTHNPAQRKAKFTKWLEETGKNCSALQLITLRSNLALWLGTALNAELAGSVDELMEAKNIQP